MTDDGTDEGDGGDADRTLTYLLVGVGLFAVVALGLLAYVAATGAGGGAAPAEDVRWELDRVNGTHAEVVHAGGPTVSPEGLTVTVDGLERRVRWSDATLSEGDRGLVRVAGGSRVTLHLQTNRVNRVAVGRWRLNGSDGRGTTVSTT